MTTERALQEWEAAGIISAEQSAALTALARKQRLSIFFELNALLYLGVLAFAAGLGWTIRDHFASLGDAAILLSLAAIVAGSFFYCFSRTPPYSNGRVESPTLAFDYLLYLACLAFAAGLGYVEYRFQLLQDRWDDYLLASAFLYFVCAYRFDNRFVLSLALSTLAGWFGVRLNAWHLVPESIRVLGIAYGALVGGLGLWSWRQRVKPHFLEAYLHVGVNAIFLALASGAVSGSARSLWLLALVAAAVAAVALALRFRRFAFLVYGVIYAYIGVSARVIDSGAHESDLLAYFVVSALVVVGGLVVVSRQFGREE